MTVTMKIFIVLATLGCWTTLILVNCNKKSDEKTKITVMRFAFSWLCSAGVITGIRLMLTMF